MQFFSFYRCIHSSLVARFRLTWVIPMFPFSKILARRTSHCKNRGWSEWNSLLGALIKPAFFTYASASRHWNRNESMFPLVPIPIFPVTISLYGSSCIPKVVEVTWIYWYLTLCVTFLQPPSIYLFSSNPTLENFLNYFFDMKQNEAGEAERKTLSAVTDFAYFCLTKDKLSLLPHWLSLIKVGTLKFSFTALSVSWLEKKILSTLLK